MKLCSSTAAIVNLSATAFPSVIGLGRVVCDYICIIKYTCTRFLSSVADFNSKEKKLLLTSFIIASAMR